MRTAISFAAAAAAITLGSAADATVLTFDQSAPNTPTETGALVATSYGDRVAAAEQFGYTYEAGEEGFTPNVQLGLAGERLDAGFPGLGTALTGTAGQNLVIGFLADEGFEASLFGLDVAATGEDLVIPLIRVSDATDVLFEITDFAVPQDGTTIDFVALAGGALTGRVLDLAIVLSSLGEAAQQVAFDDLRFGQASIGGEVPLPGALVFMATGLGLAALRRR